MSASPESSKGAEALDLTVELHLPPGEDFRSRRLPLSLEQITRLSEAQLPILNGQPDAEERRLRMQITERFVLKP